MITHVSPNTFDLQVLQQSHSKPVAVDFWAPWCGPCHLLIPALEETAAASRDFAAIMKVNVDDHPALAAAYGIRSLPTLLFFKNGQLYDRIHGVVDKELILNRLLEESHVSSHQQLVTA
ncbi:MAG: thioredoxin [Verrucomicrobiota bacterium]